MASLTFRGSEELKRAVLYVNTVMDCPGGTRTCIHTPAAPMHVEDVSPNLIEEALHGAALVYSDGRLAEAALQVAKAAKGAGIPVLVEAERLRPGLNELLAHADYVVTSARFPQVTMEPGQTLWSFHCSRSELCRFSAASCLIAHGGIVAPQAWTGEAGLGDALLSTFYCLPHIRWMVTTLGSKGSVFLERANVLQDEDAIRTAKLEDVLSQLSNLIRESRAESPNETAACTAASGVEIRCVPCTCHITYICLMMPSRMHHRHLNALVVTCLYSTSCMSLQGWAISGYRGCCSSAVEP